MARLVYQIDEIAHSRESIAAELKRAIPDLALKQFESSSSALEALSTEPQAPWMVLAPEKTHAEILTWIKRSPVYHLSAVILLGTAEAEARKSVHLKHGAFASINIDTANVQIAKIIEQYTKQELPFSDLYELDQGFAEELGETVPELRNICSGLNLDRTKELYQKFHTIKGSAYSLQFPHLGEFIHLAEGFIGAVQLGNCAEAPEVTTLLKTTITYIETQMQHLKEKTLMALPTPELTQSISKFIDDIKTGWRPSATAAIATEIIETPGEVTRQSDSIRIKNERLDELQLKFKKIIQLRLQLSTFANQLKQEFFDESFPNDLLKIVEQLNSSAGDVMEFFISLRVMPVGRLKNFCDQVARSASRSLNKAVTLEFQSDAGIEVDQAVMECLENSFTHILKNGIDHGIENADLRKQRNKTESGSIKVELKRENSEFFNVVVTDDGGGIDPTALKAAFFKKGLLSQEKMNQLSDDAAIDLIFVDGLSTKQEVSDLSGRGVGLGAVKESIIKLGGSIKVSSSLGKGSSFFIRLPRYFKL